MTPDFTFETAIAESESLLAAIASQSLTESEITDWIAQLVQSEAGARGFFVTYLTAPLACADQPRISMLAALATSPQIVSDLLVKNLAMSTAMGIAHRRNDDETNAQGSDLVQKRSQQLIMALKLEEVTQKLTQLQQTLTTSSGTYQGFIERWGYDPDQKQGILDVINTLQESIP